MQLVHARPITKQLMSFYYNTCRTPDGGPASVSSFVTYKNQVGLLGYANQGLTNGPLVAFNSQQRLVSLSLNSKITRS